MSGSELYKHESADKEDTDQQDDKERQYDSLQNRTAVPEGAVAA